MSEIEVALRGDLEWHRIDADLAVATRSGDFAGYVDRRAIGRFFTFDHHARLIGTFDDEGSARGALGPSARRGRRRLALPGLRLLRALVAR